MKTRQDAVRANYEHNLKLQTLEYINDLMVYLESPKFQHDTTVQVKDVLNEGA